MPASVPIVTVIIPVFNGEDYLKEAIDSVLGQTYGDFEILIIDDGSTDGTWPIVQRYIADSPGQIRGLQKPNGGTASALNEGILAAAGKYIAWLSHDDRFLPHKLQTQLDLLRIHPEISGVYSDYFLIDSAGMCIGLVHSAWYPQRVILRRFLQNMFINGSTLLIERRCLQEAGLFDEELRYAHDALMWVHLLQHYALAYVPEALTEYRVHSGQGTRKKKAIRNDNQLWLRQAVDTYSVHQIFPELTAQLARPEDLAKAYLYLGDVFTIRYRQITLGFEQYWKAWLAWRNLHNPVFYRSALGVVHVIKDKLREVFREIQQLVARDTGEESDPSYSEIELSFWCEIIPDIDTSSVQTE